MKAAARERHHNDTIESWNDMRGFHVQLGLENGVHDRVRHTEQHGVFGSSKPIQQFLVLVGQGARATENSPWRDEIVVDGQRCAPWVVGGVRTRKPPIDNEAATRPHSMQHLVRGISLRPGRRVVFRLRLQLLQINRMRIDIGLVSFRHACKEMEAMVNARKRWNSEIKKKLIVF